MCVNCSWIFFSDPLPPCVFNTEIIFHFEGLEMEECVGTGSKGRSELRLSVCRSACRLRHCQDDELHHQLSSSSSLSLSSSELLESSGSISRMSWTNSEERSARSGPRYSVYKIVKPCACAYQQVKNNVRKSLYMTTDCVNLEQQTTIAFFLPPKSIPLVCLSLV